MKIKCISFFGFIFLSLFSIWARAEAQACGVSPAANEKNIDVILKGDYPDPSIVKDGDTYYMVHSSFEYYPGLLIWKSKDLINWEPVVHALTKYVGSVFAPDLVKYDGRFYIYFPAAGKNYVVYADSIEGPWSDPLPLEISLIDPGHIADEEGNRYLYFSSGSYAPLTKDGLALAGNAKASYKGWPVPRDWVIECVCLEGPKLMKKDDYYYLTTAVGGTAGPPTGHMIITARSKSPTGPWSDSPFNPVIRTLSSAEKWWSKGHGTPIEDKFGDWWMVYHAYENGHHNLGRQSLISPIDWTKDGWYRMSSGDDVRQLPKKRTKDYISDNFAKPELGLQWHFFKDYDKSRIQIKNKTLTLKSKGKTFSESPPLLTKPNSRSYDVSVKMKVKGGAQGGLFLFYDERAFSGISSDGEHIIPVIRGWGHKTDKVESKTIYFKLEKRCQLVNQFFSYDGKNWIKNETSLEVSPLNHNALNGFLSLQIGLASAGQGEVEFSEFKYRALD